MKVTTADASARARSPRFRSDDLSPAGPRRSPVGGRQRQLSIVLSSLVLCAVQLRASVEPVIYTMGHNVERLAADSGRQRSVRTHLGAVEAIAVNGQGELLALVPGGVMYRVEPQTGESEAIGYLGLGFGGDADLAFDPNDDLYLSISQDGETSLYRFGPDFGGRTLLGSIPLAVTGITFLGPSLLALVEDTLYEIDLPSLAISPRAGPFPLDGLGRRSLSLRGLVGSPDGRLFTAAVDSVLIAPPPAPLLAELELGSTRLLHLWSIRLGAGLALRTEGCHPDETTACSHAGRFAATITWNRPGGEPQTASPRFLTSDSGVFTFLEGDNLEVLVKVLDACAISGRFWVFVSSATSLEHRVTVRDTFAEVAREYHHPPGLHPPIADTGAFAACL